MLKKDLNDWQERILKIPGKEKVEYLLVKLMGFNKPYLRKRFSVSAVTRGDG